jgi:hypothetical protein
MSEVNKCVCGEHPLYFAIEGDYGIVYHKMICRKCKIVVNAQSKKRAIEKWNNLKGEF